MIATGPSIVDSNKLEAPFSEAPTICNPLFFNTLTVPYIEFVRHTGILNKAPAEVLMASGPIAAPPFSGTTMACIPAQEAVLAIAPKLRTSVIPSRTKINGSSPLS